MIAATRRLREPGAWALVGYVAIALLIRLIDMFSSGGFFDPLGVTAHAFGGGSSTFSVRAYEMAPQMADISFAVVLIFAVVLVHTFGPVSRYAKAVTLIALVEYGVTVLLSLILIFSAFGADGVSGHAKFDSFALGLVGTAVLAGAGWFTFLIYQGYLPQRPPGAPGGWQSQGQQGFQQQGYQQQGQWGGPQNQGQVQQGGFQQPPQQQTPPPGGFGWQQGGAQPAPAQQPVAAPQQPAPAPQQATPDAQLTQATPAYQPPAPSQPAGSADPGPTHATQVMPSVPQSDEAQAGGQQPWSPTGPASGDNGGGDDQQQGGGGFPVGNWTPDS
jgi:hypothetical protein